MLAKNSAEFLQQVTSDKKWDMYKAWVICKNAPLITQLPEPDEYYYNLLETSPKQALEEFNLMPIRCYITFLKMRSFFRIHQNKKDWRYFF